MIAVKQKLYEPWVEITDESTFWKQIGAYEPLVVYSQLEADYLWSMQLMLGREILVWVYGKDFLPGDDYGMPPTYVNIDIPLK